jgi:hypothetical protein
VSVPGPVLGPCTSWIDGADVAACCSSVPDFDDPAIFDAVALEASMALYEVSGRLFTGLCDPVTVRPCRDGCSCWGPSSLGLGPWYWSSAAWGAGGWGWGNECGDRLGCRPLSRIRLAGYPVREIVEVLVDGAVLPALDDNGNPNYRLDRWRFLVRMDDPGPPVQPRSWRHEGHPAGRHRRAGAPRELVRPDEADRARRARPLPQVVLAHPGRPPARRLLARPPAVRSAPRLLSCPAWASRAVSGAPADAGTPSRLRPSAVSVTLSA